MVRSFNVPNAFAFVVVVAFFTGVEDRSLKSLLISECLPHNLMNYPKNTFNPSTSLEIVMLQLS